jgi:acyl carrier protein phosphodiesterase
LVFHFSQGVGIALDSSKAPIFSPFQWYKNFKKMNLLAHAYLSFGEPAILVGNMISDFVKGKKKFDYSAGVQKGIALHRAIDTYTDAHPITKIAKSYFKEPYRLYAGACVDVAYDYFLANDKAAFENDAQLAVFAKDTYILLQQSKEMLPEKFAQMLPYMQSQNWLYNYGKKEGIQKSFEGLIRRSAYLTDAAPAFAIFNEQLAALQECYNAFFPSLKKFAALQYEQLMGE